MGQALPAGERPGLEAPQVDRVGHPDGLGRVDAEQAPGALGCVPRRHQQPVAAGGPAAQPLDPGVGVGPAARRRLDLLQHPQLGAVELAEHRDLRERARGCLVDRGEVVQVEHLGAAGAGAPEGLLPGLDQPLVGAVADGGEDPVRRAGPVLVGRLEGRVGGQRGNADSAGRNAIGGDQVVAGAGRDRQQLARGADRQARQQIE